jgi:hypothetical protein
LKLPNKSLLIYKLPQSLLALLGGQLLKILGLVGAQKGVVVVLYVVQVLIVGEVLFASKILAKYTN